MEEGERLRSLVAEADAASHDEPLHAVRALAEARSELERALVLGVRRARHRGATWAEVAAALGVSRQAAHQRYGHGWRDR